MNLITEMILTTTVSYPKILSTFLNKTNSVKNVAIVAEIFGLKANTMNTNKIAVRHRHQTQGIKLNISRREELHNNKTMVGCYKSAFEVNLFKSI